MLKRISNSYLSEESFAEENIRQVYISEESFAVENLRKFTFQKKALLMRKSVTVVNISEGGFAEENI